ncbi:MAG TPA: ABC transporter permease [Puia sp.]|jgi:ABC-2 type transport system permease protein
MGDFLNSLRVEWLKLKYYRTFWILLAVVAVCIPAFNYVIYDVTDNSFPKINGQNLLGNPFSFPNVWSTVPYNAGILIFMPAILIITLFTNEYSYKTHRQNIIDGWSRSRFIYIKITEIFLLTLFVTGIVVLTCLYFGFLTRTNVQPKAGWNQFRFIFFFFIEMLDYSMIAVLFALLIRRAGLAMGIFFLYMIVEQFVVSLGRNKYKLTWVDYLPEEVADRLIPQPFARRILTSGNNALWEKHVPLYLSIAIIYITIYILFISWRFRKTDL